MSVLEDIKLEIDSCWDDKAIEHSRSWAERIFDSIESLSEVRNSFKQPAPLRAYTCVADVKKALFSLRFKGQSVAQIKEIDKKIVLSITPAMKAANAKYFGYEPNLKETSWDWQNDSVSQSFRKYFKEKYKQVGNRKYLPKGSKKTASEHNVESLILEEMQKTDKSKFGGTCHHIQPVMVAGCPLQCPLPISASKGVIRRNKGNIDVLARTKNRNLSVWELKKPLETLSSKAHIQAFSYAYTLLKMLRSDSGELWYRIFGFNSPIPSSLTIEAVPVFGGFLEDRRKKIISELETFIRENAQALVCGSDRINFRMAFYEFAQGDDPFDPRNVLLSETFSYDLDINCSPESLKVVPGSASW